MSRSNLKWTFASQQGDHGVEGPQRQLGRDFVPTRVLFSGILSSGWARRSRKAGQGSA